MPPRKWPHRAQDILRQVELLQAHTAGVDWATFQHNEVLQGDVLYRLHVIGEAAGYIPDEVKNRFPEIPWQELRETRNVISHVYFRVNLARIWRIVERDLAPLAEHLRALLAEGAGED